MINTLFKNLKEKVSERKFAKKELINWEDKLDTGLNNLEDLEQARIIFQKAAQVTQSQLSSQISNIVTSALAAVFNDPYEFKVDFVKRRNVTECDLLFERNGKEKSPLNSCGYGAADIASLALRVAYWKLGNTRNVLILDEPLRNLSKEKQPKASMMISQLSKMKGNLQFIIVTHNSALMESADKCFTVTKINNVSQVKEMYEFK